MKTIINLDLKQFVNKKEKTKTSAYWNWNSKNNELNIFISMNELDIDDPIIFGILLNFLGEYICAILHLNSEFENYKFNKCNDFNDLVSCNPFRYANFMLIFLYYKKDKSLIEQEWFRKLVDNYETIQNKM